MAGVSLVELMIGITLGLIILAGLATLFANTSAARNELERASRQIENGRFAIDTLSDDLRLAGFYGELAVTTIAAPAALPDPCSVDPAVWASAIPIALQGYDNGTAAPGCMPADVQAGSDILVVRRTAACEAGVSGCPAAAGSLPYFQAAKCSVQVALPTTSYRIGQLGTATFDRQIKDCATNANLRQYYVRIYYISTDNGQGSPVPTLKRLELGGDGVNGNTFTEVPLVEGIEKLNFEYGIDTDGDGQPNAYTADPTNYAPAGCGTCNAVSNWANTVAVRITLLARNIDTTPGFTDSKTYTLGLDAAGSPITYTPNDGYRRHVYNSVVRVVNVAQRKELP